MNHASKSALRLLTLSALSALAVSTSALAAEDALAIAAGCTTGDSLRLRAEPSTASRIITTLDKHCAVAVLDDGGDGWYRICYDGQTGYVSADYLIIDQDNLFTASGRVPEGRVHLRAGPGTEHESLGILETGAAVTVNGLENGWYAVTRRDGTEGYIRSDLLTLTGSAGAQSSHAAAVPAGADGSSVVDSAMQHLGTRYVYGGASPNGFDCSGFTMYIYAQFGHALPHSATSQWLSGKGTKIYSISDLQPGDLVFFNDPKRNAGKACSHAGIYIGDGQHIHASSSRSKGVIISDLTSGYYNDYFIGGIRL